MSVPFVKHELQHTRNHQREIAKQEEHLAKGAIAMMEKRKRKLGAVISDWLDTFVPPGQFPIAKDEICDYIDSKYSDWDFWRRYNQIEEDVLEVLEKRWIEP